MGSPARDTNAERDRERDLLGPSRILRKTCEHCGAKVEIDMGRAPQAMPQLDLDDVMMALADRIACDQCAKKFIGRQQAEQLRDRAQRMIESKQVLAGFGRHALQASIKELEFANRRSWARAIEWLESPSGSVIVVGEPDSGKTWLARTLVMDLWLKGWPVMEVAGWDLFSGGLLYHSDEVTAYTKGLRSMKVLYIQGIDRGEPKAKHLDLLLNIMEERYERGAITIMETQLDGEQICTKWERLTGDPAIGGDILSRLHPYTKLPMVQPKKDGKDIGMRQLAAIMKEQKA